jgi:hypothetical protein
VSPPEKRSGPREEAAHSPVPDATTTSALTIADQAAKAARARVHGCTWCDQPIEFGAYSCASCLRLVTAMNAARRKAEPELLPLRRSA